MERLRNLTTVPLAMQTPLQRVLTTASLGVSPHLPVLRTSVGASAALGLAAVVSFWSPSAHQPVPTWSEKHFSDFVSFSARPHADEPAPAQNDSAQVVELRGETDRPAAQRKLTKEQATLAQYLAKRYRVALDTTQEFVEMSYRVARDMKMDPWLILAIMGIESSFDPRARSDKGAQGLMQVLTRVHADKFAPFGGVSSAFDPLSNIKVGAQILKDYIDRDGTIAGALKSYVGAAFMPSDGGYGAKVLTERERLAAVAQGRPMNEAAIKASLAVAATAGSLPVPTTINAPSIIEVNSDAIRTTVVDIKSEPIKPGLIDLKGDVFKIDLNKGDVIKGDHSRGGGSRGGADKLTISDSTDTGSQ